MLDIELDQKNRIEIKTTVTEKRIHSFKHNQIYRKDINVYVISIMLEQSKEGFTLYDLFQHIIALYDNPDSKFELYKLMKKCNVTCDNKGLCIAFKKAYDDLKIFDVVNLPKLEVDIPNGITNVKYDVNCELTDNIDPNYFAQYLTKNF